MKDSILTSKRLWLAAFTALTPVIAKEIFGYEMSANEVNAFVAAFVGLIGSYTFRDHKPSSK